MSVCRRMTTIIIFILLFTLTASPAARAEYCTCLQREVLPRLELTTPYTRGEEVTYLQARLLEQGFDPGPVDGVYGPLTHRAVVSFARSHGLDITTGVGMNMWQELIARPVTANPAPVALKNPYIIIDVATLKLTIYSDGKPYREYPVACGTSETPTPIGEWAVVHKDMNWGTGFGTRWMGLNVPWGIFGIHGTNKPWSIGTYASHGCIRMYNEDVEELYPLVPTGTPVKILDSSNTTGVNKFPITGLRPLKIGATGPDVVYVQEKLRQKGCLLGYADGRYGKMTTIGVKYLQNLYGRPATGVVDKETYRILGLDDTKDGESNTE